ncbi:MAG: hypothetical protein CXR31_05970 [Geobacter sp.]|nr:MAG: hypothetical protein CXR31_05970 [Geobacter sp.]
MSNVLRPIARTVFGKLLPRVAYPVVRGPLNGARIILGALEGEGGGATAYFNMLEPEQTAAIAARLKQGDVFFDIGANVGYYTLLASRQVGREGKVFAFEPVVRNLAYLYRHLLLNGANNVTVIAAACSESLSLALFSSGENFATGHIDGSAVTQENTFLVPTLSVDAVVKKTGVSPNAMKIDVEGAELSVLKGAKNTIASARPEIFLSTHSASLRTDCLAYLEEAGYTVEALDSDDDPSSFLATHYEGRIT